MSDVVVRQAPDTGAVHPPAISLRESGPWLLFGAALLLLAYVVGLNESSSVHEWVHDGRHLLGIPCH